jgi:hypothetical protein
MRLLCYSYSFFFSFLPVERGSAMLTMDIFAIAEFLIFFAIWWAIFYGLASLAKFIWDRIFLSKRK